MDFFAFVAIDHGRDAIVDTADPIEALAGDQHDTRSTTGIVSGAPNDDFAIIGCLDHPIRHWQQKANLQMTLSASVIQADASIRPSLGCRVWSGRIRALDTLDRYTVQSARITCEYSLNNIRLPA
jgi:hypothetical protein